MENKTTYNTVKSKAPATTLYGTDEDTVQQTGPLTRVSSIKTSKSRFFWQ
jgi:hypothetical protein